MFDILTLNKYNIKNNCPYCLSFSDNIKNTIYQTGSCIFICKICKLTYCTSETEQRISIIYVSTKIKRRTYTVVLDFEENKTLVLCKLDQIAEFDLTNINPSNVKDKLKKIILFS